MDMQQFNILNKTKLLHFKLSNFDRKSVLLLLICMQSIYAIIKIVSERTCFLALQIAKIDILHYNNQAIVL
jgi:hypothetical protein